MPIRLSSEEIQKRLLEHQSIFGRYRRLGRLLGDMKKSRDAHIKKLEEKILGLHGEMRSIGRKLADHNDIVERVHDSYFDAQTLYDIVETGDMDDIANKIIEIRSRAKQGIDLNRIICYLDVNSVMILPDNINAEYELDEFLESFKNKYLTTKIYKNA